MWIFGKSIETRKGNFAAGTPLPPEYDTRETRAQFIGKFGADVLVQGNAMSTEARFDAIEKSLAQIKAALGIKEEKSEAKKPQGQVKGRA